MKKLNNTNILLAYIFVMFSATLYQCKPTNTTISNNNNTTSTSKIKPNALETETQSILDMLSKLPGIQIDGSGSSASIIIRGVGTINTGDSQPLFVVNGAAVGNGIRSIINTVPANQIQSIRVLKSSDASFYGIRGANGVIEIRLK